MYHNSFIHSSVSGHLDCCHVLTIVNSAAINSEIHVSFSILVSSGYMHRSGIAESYGSFIPRFLRNLYTAFHSDCISLHSHQQCKRVSFSPHPPQHLLFENFWWWPFSLVWGDNFIVVLIYISLIISDVEYLFLCSWPSVCLLWRNVCLELFPTFWFGCLFFWYWAVWAVCIFWKLILCQLYHCKYFLCFWRLSFRFVYGFFCCVEDLCFN